MVCSLGNGRMAVMARLLSAGSVSQSVSEEVGQQKLTDQDIYRELCEADEANLLDEEDMHVFGVMPMSDPLHLVCCNACKKPVKASQYAAHAELCRSLNSAEVALGHDGGIGHRKPLKKERKKSLTTYTNQVAPVVERERYESIDANVVATTGSLVDQQPRNHFSFSMDAKNVASMMDGKGTSHEYAHHSACVMPPPTKRSKCVSYVHRPLSDDQETASGLTKITAIQGASTCRESQLRSPSGSEEHDRVVSKYPQQSHECCQLMNGIPVPLATKLYYSQRNNRLRASISHLYHNATSMGHQSNLMTQELSQKSLMQLQDSSHSGSSREEAADLGNNKREPSPHNSDLIQNSEACLETSGGSIPLTNLSNHYPVDGSVKTAPVGLLKGKYLSKPYFGNNSGKSLGNIQQPNGSVPVL